MKDMHGGLDKRKKIENDTCVVTKKLGSQQKNKLRQLKEAVKRLMLLVEVPIVLYQAITS